jgi:hypothetical protein
MGKSARSAATSRGTELVGLFEAVVVIEPTPLSV